MRGPTIIELPTTASIEAARARYWRKHSLHKTQAELAKLLGYSTLSIIRFERGYTATGKPINKNSWQRYRLACAGLVGAKGSPWAPTGEELRAWMDAKGYDE